MKLELSLACNDLPSMDWQYKSSDPMVVLYEEKARGKWAYFDRTNPAKNNLNPVYDEKFLVTYHFKCDTYLKFKIFDIDEWDEIDNFDKQDFIGECTVSIHQIVSSHKELVQPLKFYDKKTG